MLQVLLANQQKIADMSILHVSNHCLTSGNHTIDTLTHYMGCKDLEMLVALHESGNDYGGMSAMASDLEEMSGNFLRRTILVMKLGGFHT